MATGGIPLSTPDKDFKLSKSDIRVTISMEDIFKIQASAIVAGEDQGLNGKGGVSRSLLDISPKDFIKIRDELKSKHRSFEKGKVYSVPFPSVIVSRLHDTVSFNIVYYAIVPLHLQSKAADTKEWKNTMKQLYHNIIEAANKDGKESLVTPLLGSGGAGASVEDSTEVLTEALASFQKGRKSPNIKRIIVCCRQKNAYEEMIKKLTSSVDARLCLSSQSTSVSVSDSSSARQRSGSGTAAARSNISRTRKASPSQTCPLNEKRGANKSVDKSSRNGHAANYDDDSMSNLTVILDQAHLDEDKEPEKEEEEEMEQDQETEDKETKDKEKKLEEDDMCPICLDVMVSPKKLDKCGHIFCRECIDNSFQHHKPACPSCNTMYGLVTGNQPNGTMHVSWNRSIRLPGYKNCDTIVIDYAFPSGIQGKEHPYPGLGYSGTSRRAFLPGTEEGKKVYRLLHVSFENRLTFTVGKSRTTGADNVVTWNDIHHKTNIDGGPTNFGYPDPSYLSRVEEELAAKGVTEDSLKGRKFDI